MEQKTNSIQMTARIAGILTLLIVVFAPFSMIYVPTTLVVPGDAATTANICDPNWLIKPGVLLPGI